MKFREFAAMGAAAAALLMAGSASATTYIANSTNSGGLLTGSTTLTVNTLSNTEFTLEITNPTSTTWAGASKLVAFAFNGNILGTAGTLSSTETLPGSGTGAEVDGGLNSGGCDGTGFGGGFCFGYSATVGSDMVFDIKTTGTFDYSSTNVPDLKIAFDNSDGGKVGTLFSADVPFCSSNCGVTTTGGGGGIPEPATWAMMLVGFGSIGAALRSRRKMALATA